MPVAKTNQDTIGITQTFEIGPITFSTPGYTILPIFSGLVVTAVSKDVLKFMETTLDNAIVAEGEANAQMKSGKTTKVQLFKFYDQRTMGTNQKPDPVTQGFAIDASGFGWEAKLTDLGDKKRALTLVHAAFNVRIENDVARAGEEVEPDGPPGPDLIQGK